MSLTAHFRYHVTEYCTVIGTHSVGDKLLYGYAPDWILPSVWNKSREPAPFHL